MMINLSNNPNILVPPSFISLKLCTIFQYMPVERFGLIENLTPGPSYSLSYFM